MRLGAFVLLHILRGSGSLGADLTRCTQQVPLVPGPQTRCLLHLSGDLLQPLSTQSMPEVGGS